MRWVARKSVQAVGLAVAATLAGWGGQAAGWLDRLEDVSWDLRCRVDAALVHPAPAAPVILVLVDQDSLDWAQRENGWSWPWPREAWGVLSTYIRSGGARGVGFDILFTESSAYGVWDDQTFAGALADAGGVAGSVFLGREAGTATRWPPDLHPAAGWPAASDEPARFSRAAFPVAPLASAFDGLGHVVAFPEPDGIIRRLHPLLPFDGVSLPALGLAVWGLNAEAGAVVQTPSGLQGPDGRHLPLDGAGRAWIRYPDPDRRFESLKAGAVLQSAIRAAGGGGEEGITADRFAGALVLVGYSAPGLLDLKPTPLDPRSPGVEIHASLLANWIDGHVLRTPPTGLAGLVSLLWCLLAAGGVLATRRPAANAAGVVAALAVPAGMATGVHLAGWVWPLVWPTLAAGGASAGATLINYATEGRQRRFIRTAFRHYLSPAVIDRLLAHPDQLRLGGERRVLTLFFSDLEGFSTLSERLDPTELTGFLNDYLSCMTDLVLEEGGTLDKYEGDAIVAFWNAPLDQADHAARACRAALRCREALARRNPEWQRLTGAPVRMRIGVHTGPVVVGNLGSSQRFDYSVLGDAANLASRLEGANKRFGTDILLSGETVLAAEAEAPPVRHLGRIRVVGRSAPVDIYTPTGASPPPPAWERGLALIQERRFSEAAEAFETWSADPASRAYARRCRAAAAGDEWDAVWNLSEK